MNFNESRAVWKFFNAFNGRKWDSSDSPKIRRIVSARIQVFDGKNMFIDSLYDPSYKLTKFLYNCW